MSLHLTPDQSRAANPLASAWVEASAGTGKTHVLTTRMLSQLLNGTSPERILALTFTKAAAAEMANRILAHLGRWAVLEDEKLRAEIAALTPDTKTRDEDITRARGLFAQVLDLPRGLNIQTIHAFCQSLLGRFPVESGLPPQFQVMDERTQDEILSATRDKLMGESRAFPDAPLTKALGTLVTLAGEGDFNKLMAALLRERVVLRRLISISSALDTVLKRALKIRSDETAHQVLKEACSDKHLDTSGLKRAAKALCEGSAKEAERGGPMQAWLLGDADYRLAHFNDYTGAFLTKDGKILARLANKATLDKDPAVGDILAQEAERILSVVERLNLHAFIERSTALLRVGLALAVEFDAAKQRLGLADYDDLIAKTAELLTEKEMAGWVLYKLDGGIDHILIDEAQDTNPEQWSVIEALSAEFFAGEGASDVERTIFTVGDVKQSIYGFQRAAPDLFDHYQNHFRKLTNHAGRRFESVPLDLSFRSTDAVLALVDAVFTGEAGHGLSHSERQIRHVAHRQGHAGRVELWPTLHPEPQEAREIWEAPIEVIPVDNPQARLAALLADKIAGWIGKEALPARGRTIRAGDIMILVRRRTALIDNLVRALKGHGVSVAGVDRFDLLNPIAVQDLLALAQFAVLPDDDLNLACVLKGPFIGLDEDALFTLAYGREGSLWRALKSSADFPKARAFLENILARADYAPPYEFFESILNQNGGRRALLSRLGVEAEEAIDELLSQAIAFEANHTPSLDGFLHWIHARASEVKRDPEQASNAVRIMTVHGAKGLQAPVVILPDTCQTAKDDAPLLTLKGEAGPSLPVWYKNKNDLIGPVADLKAKREANAAAEAKRLLYVALTRAEDRLVVTGWETKKGRGENCWYNMIANGFTRLDGVVEEGEALVYQTTQRVEAVTDAKKTIAKTAPDLPDWAKRTAPAEETPPRPLAPSRLEDGPASMSPLSLGRANAFERGRIIHKLLQRLPDMVAKERLAAGERYLSFTASHWREEERKDVLQAVLSLIDDARFAELFSPNSLAEAPLSGIVGDKVISGQIDRLVLGSDEIIFADYKTNQTPPQSSDDIPRAVIKQMAAYHAVLRAIYGAHRITGVLIWTADASAHVLSHELLRETLI